MIPVLRIRDADGNVREITAIRGAKGASAYDIAKKLGFEGTEVEWLASLKGEAGSVMSVNGVSPDENGNVIIEIRAPKALTINGQSYDGSEEVEIKIDVPTEDDIKAIVDAKIVAGTAEVADGDASTYPEGTIYVVIE